MAVALDIFVRGIPKGQPRPRARIVYPHGGKPFVHVYTQLTEYVPNTKPRVRKEWDIGKWREAVRLAVTKAWTVYTPHPTVGHISTGRLKPPLVGPLRVDLTFYFPRTEEMLEKPFKWGKDAFPYIGKPDRDNLDKPVLDVMTELDEEHGGGVWKDDAQVCQGEPTKWYSRIGGAPGVRILVETLAEQPAELYEPMYGDGSTQPLLPIFPGRPA